MKEAVNQVLSPKINWLSNTLNKNISNIQHHFTWKFCTSIVAVPKKQELMVLPQHYRPVNSSDHNGTKIECATIGCQAALCALQKQSLDISIIWHSSCLLFLTSLVFDIFSWDFLLISSNSSPLSLSRLVSTFLSLPQCPLSSSQFLWAPLNSDQLFSAQLFWAPLRFTQFVLTLLSSGHPFSTLLRLSQLFSAPLSPLQNTVAAAPRHTSKATKNSVASPMRLPGASLMGCGFCMS